MINVIKVSNIFRAVMNRREIRFASLMEKITNSFTHVASTSTNLLYLRFCFISFGKLVLSYFLIIIFGPGWYGSVD